MTKEEQEKRHLKVIELIKKGEKVKNIAKLFRIRVQTVYEICKKAGIRAKDYTPKRDQLIDIDYSRGEVNCCPKCRKFYGYAYNGALRKY